MTPAIETSAVHDGAATLAESNLFDAGCATKQSPDVVAADGAQHRVDPFLQYRAGQQHPCGWA